MDPSRSGTFLTIYRYHIQVSQPVESESRDSNSDKANAKRGGGMNKKRQFKKISSKADVSYRRLSMSFLIF